MNDDDPNFFVFLSKIFSDPSLPIEFSDVTLFEFARIKRSEIKIWVTNCINYTYTIILRKVIEDENIPAVLFWEMGKYYERMNDISEPELIKVKNFLINSMEKHPNSSVVRSEIELHKSLISLDIFVQGKKLYFCIPLILLDNELGLKALKRARPIQSHVHARKPEKLKTLYDRNIPFFEQELQSA